MPSKAEMARQERRWRAESIVRDSLTNTPQFKAAVSAVEKELAKTESNVRRIALKKVK